MSGVNLNQIFNEQMEQFIDDILYIFPDDTDIIKAKEAIRQIRKFNPGKLMKLWREHITLKYDENIQNGDIRYFTDKDYTSDISAGIENQDQQNQIRHIVDRLRRPICEMDKSNQEKTMQYIQNLTALTKL